MGDIFWSGDVFNVDWSSEMPVSDLLVARAMPVTVKFKLLTGISEYEYSRAPPVTF